MVQKRHSNFALLTWLALFVCLTGSGRAAIKDTFIEFNSIAPAGFTLTECWEAMGMDPQENIYIGFVAISPNGEPQDNVIFKYNPNTGVKKCLGTLRTVAEAANNLGPCQYWSQPEAIPKGHTHFPYFNGKMYIGTQSFHDVVNEGPSALPNYRGAACFQAVVYQN